MLSREEAFDSFHADAAAAPVVPPESSIIGAGYTPAAAVGASRQAGPSHPRTSSSKVAQRRGRTVRALSIPSGPASKLELALAAKGAAHASSARAPFAGATRKRPVGVRLPPITVCVICCAMTSNFEVGFNLMGCADNLQGAGASRLPATGDASAAQQSLRSNPGPSSSLLAREKRRTSSARFRPE
jgi:hypothetical protein